MRFFLNVMLSLILNLTLTASTLYSCYRHAMTKLQWKIWLVEPSPSAMEGCLAPLWELLSSTHHKSVLSVSQLGNIFYRVLLPLFYSILRPNLLRFFFPFEERYSGNAYYQKASHDNARCKAIFTFHFYMYVFYLTHLHAKMSLYFF